MFISSTILERQLKATTGNGTGFIWRFILFQLPYYYCVSPFLLSSKWVKVFSHINSVLVCSCFKKKMLPPKSVDLENKYLLLLKSPWVSRVDLGQAQSCVSTQWQISWELAHLEWLHSQACWSDGSQPGQGGDRAAYLSSSHRLASACLHVSGQVPRE